MKTHEVKEYKQLLSVITLATGLDKETLIGLALTEWANRHMPALTKYNPDLRKYANDKH